MIKIARLTLLTVYNIILLVVLSFIIAHLAAFVQNIRPISNFGPNDFKKIEPYVGALKTRGGDRYCSSVSINYKGKERTLTNMHCCERSEFTGNLIRIENRLEKILFISHEADVCILTSTLKSKLRLAKSEFNRFEPALVMGYPYGFDLTPREGYIIILNDLVSVNYGDYVLTTPSNWTTSITFPGNSGSGVFNKKGELVNLIYAGPDPLFMYGITVPHRYIKNALEASLNAK